MNACMEPVGFSTSKRIRTTLLFQQNLRYHCSKINQILTQSLPYALFAVPTGTVQEFKASSLNSTSIQLRWQPLAVIDRNGIIANYEISWINTCLSGSSTAENSTEQCLLSLSHKTKHYGNVTISADKSSVVLTDFVPFTRYEFGVVAATSVGQGPRFMLMSDTPQDGKAKINFILSMILHSASFL